MNFSGQLFIMETLTMILNDPNIKHAISERNVPVEGIYTDYSDGSNTKFHPVIAEHPNSLQIVGYYDELEICNPLGSKVKKHKLGLVFLYYC